MPVLFLQASCAYKPLRLCGTELLSQMKIVKCVELETAWEEGKGVKLEEKQRESGMSERFNTMT